MYLHLEELARSRATDLVREAEHARLVASISTPGSTLRQRSGYLLKLLWQHRRSIVLPAPEAAPRFRAL
jgi:hypothetical protein